MLYPATTWACECGQMNWLGSATCFVCGGLKKETWSADDQKRAVYEADMDDPNARWRLVGFEVRTKPRKYA